jgi:hypothetical protein
LLIDHFLRSVPNGDRDSAHCPKRERGGREDRQRTSVFRRQRCGGELSEIAPFMSVPKKAPIPWDATAPYKGLGFRDIEAEVKKAEYEITELPVVKA